MTKSTTTTHLTEHRFTDFTLAPALQQGLSDAGFAYCTPIQAKCLPVALAGSDVAGQAQTGTGKTIAFLLACCNTLLTQPAPQSRRLTHPRALILAPTRELAIQIYHDAELLAKHTDLKLGLAYGGTGYDAQKATLAAGVDILIGTPGRLIDFLRQGLYDLRSAQVAVLDEADRMFDLGFIRDIRFLLRRMPPPNDRLNLLFSATLSYKVMELAYDHMNNPAEIKITAEAVVADKVTEYSFYPADEEKLPLLVNLLKRDPQKRILVFVNTRHGVDKVAATLTANGIRGGAISGDVAQNKREQLLESFKRGDLQVLVATDIAARGLHIDAVSHVYNFDLPPDADNYIHRIGRTARAGASGEAISFICERYAYAILDIEDSIGHPIPRRDIGPELLAEIQLPAYRPRPPRPPRGGARSPARPASRPRTTGKTSSRMPSRTSAAKPAATARRSAPPSAARTTTPPAPPARKPAGPAEGPAIG